MNAWSVSYASKTDFYANIPTSQVGTPDPTQLSYGRKAAMSMFESGCIGTNCDFAINLTGISSSPAQNISVTVYQLS